MHFSILNEFLIEKKTSFNNLINNKHKVYSLMHEGVDFFRIVLLNISSLLSILFVYVVILKRVSAS